VSKPIDDSVNELIVRCLAGEASPEEQKNLLEWTAASSANEQHFLAIRKTWQHTQDLYIKRKVGELNVEAEWSQFLKQAEKNNVRELPGRSHPWLRAAAAVLFTIGIGWAAFYYANQSSEVVLETAEQTREITLPDGSRVSLNKNSMLSYDEDFGEESRDITLKGEAFFDVQRNPDKPFVIEAGETQVEVLGTSFNVSAYEERQQVEVVVATGLVKLKAVAANKEVSLKPGDRGVYSKQSRELASVANSDVNFLSWKTRKIVFEDSDLRTVIETLNKIYGANISMVDAVPATCVVTVTFDGQSLEAVLNVLENTLSLTIRRSGNRIEILKAGC
jgi:transmembrane sensor